jgi:CHAT domain-containing protein
MTRFSLPLRCALVLLLSSTFNSYLTLAVPPPAIATSLDPYIDQMNSGARAYREGRFRQALDIYQALLATARRTRNPVLEGEALTLSGWAYYRLSQYQRALDTFTAAQTVLQGVLKDSGNAINTRAAGFFATQLSLSDVLQGQGLVYSQLGQYSKALALLEEALSMSRRSPSTYERDGILFNQIGTVYLRMGQPERALIYYQQALTLVDLVGYPLPLDRTVKPLTPGQLQQAIYTWKTPRPDFSRLQQALQIGYYQPVRMHPWARQVLVQTLNSVGEAYTQMRFHNKARQAYFNALKAVPFTNNSILEGTTTLNTGKSYQIGQDWDEAAQFFQKALQIGQTMGDRALQGSALHHLGQVALAAGKPAAAVPHLTAAVQAWEDLRPGLSDTSMISLFDSQVQTYRHLQIALVQQQQPERALEIAERGRARAFVELLARRWSQPQELSAARYELLAKPITLAAIRQVAKQQNTTLVQYSVITEGETGPAPATDGETGTHLYIWVVQPNGAIAFRSVPLQPLLKGESLASMINHVRTEAVGVRGRGTGNKPTRSQVVGEPIALAQALEPGTAPTERVKADGLQRLHNLLIQPIADLLPSDANARVTFIPQGNLFLVPFVALQDGQGKFLVERHTVAIAPSIQVLDLVQANAQRPLKTTAPAAPSLTAAPALIVGNPTMPKVLTQAGDRLEQLSSLPGAEDEARAIAQLLKAQPLIGPAATKAAVLQQMASAGVIHLATHGLMDDFRGLGVPGAIALAPTAQDDGLLTAAEILDLNLRADLVVLSACDTGRGRITGDGVIGLSRSLLTAGVSNVVVSLWAVPDAPTASLMTQFYDALQQQPDPAIALRKAMLATLQQYPDPRDWAAFTLIGE